MLRGFAKSTTPMLKGVRWMGVRGVDRNDPDWEEKRDFIRAVVEGHLEESGGTPRGEISVSAKEAMVELHKKDRKTYTAQKLAQMFGLPRTHVTGIIQMGLVQDELKLPVSREEYLEGQTLLENKFGVMRNQKLDVNLEQSFSPGFGGMPEEVDIAEYRWKLKKSKRRDKTIPPKEIPAYPNPPEKQLWESIELRPREDLPMRDYRIVTIDTSPRYSDANRPIQILEFDRSIRSADWNERRALMKRFRGGRRNMRKKAGALLMETVADLDRMYRMEPLADLPGMPDYFPNNDMPLTDVDPAHLTIWRMRNNPRTKKLMRGLLKPEKGKEEEEEGEESAQDEAFEPIQYGYHKNFDKLDKY